MARRPRNTQAQRRHQLRKVIAELVQLLDDVVAELMHDHKECGDACRITKLRARIDAAHAKGSREAVQFLERRSPERLAADRHAREAFR